MAVFMVLLPTFLSLVFTLSQSTSPPPHLSSPSPCGDKQNLNFNCELQELKLEIAQLETAIEVSSKNLNEKDLLLKQSEKLIEELSQKTHHLQSVLYRIEGDSSLANERLTALEEEVQLLWAASRKNNFDLHSLRFKAQDAEDRMIMVSKQVEKMADIVTEQWIQIQQLEQALQMAELRAVKAKRQVRIMRCPLLKSIDNLLGNRLDKILGMLDPYLFGRGSNLSSYKSQFQDKLKGMWTAAKTYHHELQGFIKQEMEKNELTAPLANDELVFFVVSALITFPIMGAWMLVSSRFS